MFGRRGYNLTETALADGDGTPHDKRKPEVATDSDDGIEAINVERYALNDDVSASWSHESLRAAIDAGLVKNRRKYDCRHQWKGWLSLHGLMICKVLLFLLLLSATIIITALSVRASQIRTEEEAEATLDANLLIQGNTVIAYTSCGPVQGWVEEGAFAFRGIPYALPPEGSQRWRLPVPLNRLEHCWNGTLVTNTKEYPLNSCWQTYRNGSLDGSEDCLTVDVFAPRTNRSGAKAPIVVLVAAETLAGGGGRGFDSPQLLTPKLAWATGVIFVRVRFRLGVLGFLTATVLTNSVHPPHSGNYGLADVRAALEWVKLNAGSFGGDPSSITILGHRAGATLALALTTERKPFQLFSRAWLSGPAPVSYLDDELARRDWEAIEHQGDTFIEDLECSSREVWDSPAAKHLEVVNLTACLQDMDAEDLVESMPEDWKWRLVDLPMREDEPESSHKWLTVDGFVLGKSMLPTWESEGVKVPIVIGTTSHGESTAELIQRLNWGAPGAVKKHIEESFIGEAGLTSESLDMYATTLSEIWNTTNPEPLTLLTAMISDIRSICPLITTVRFMSAKASRHPLYFYISEAHPVEMGGHVGTVDPIAKGKITSSAVGPGSDLLEILTHPVSRAEEHYGAVAQMFYTFVRHALTEKVFTGPPWVETPNKSFKLKLLSRDGHVKSMSVYPTCEFWKHKGFSIQKFKKSD
ncbi:neurotactin-like [Hetaerina americana]|uniref:neurotactin-like n=1 Tax=Hetaerina americana TaxID=62018 RepID=UPI003A7F3BDD